MNQDRSPQVAQELMSTDGKLRAIITRRNDGLFSIEVERHGIEDAREYGKFEFWASVPMSAIIVDTIERARVLAEDALRDTCATGPSTSFEGSP